jgi:hypothetical protein
MSELSHAARVSASLSPHTQEQLCRLSNENRQRLAAILGDYDRALSEFEQHDSGVARRGIGDALARAAALISIPPVMRVPLEVTRGYTADERARSLDFMRGLGAREMSASLRNALAEAPPALPTENLPIHPTLFRLGGWDLRESGHAVYGQVRFPLRGPKRRLLARLIQGQGQAVHADNLIEAAGLAIDRGAISPYISRLRRHLREHLPALPPNPIRYSDPDAYQLLVL